MSFSNPANTIARWSVVGMEGMWAKMFDPPKESPITPDLLAPTNPVPEVMAAAGFQIAPKVPHTMDLELMHNVTLPTWNNRKNGMNWFLFKNPDLTAATGNEYPSATVRVPVGVIFHATTQGKGPPPHTIHWHGLEPTTMNDGVGHCSMELGDYTYQWQAQFIGTYFAHCHRNTMQHFEFGLFFLLLCEPADAYFATQVNPAVPIGHCRDGKRRTAAGLANFPQFPGFNANHFDAPDPWTGDPALKYLHDPHAHTVPYDIEALWVLDDRDSAWSDLGDNPRATYPKYGTRPGFDDNFHNNGDDGPAAAGDFFAFNDFNADYWYVTGAAVPAAKGGTGIIPANLVIPPGLNSGVSGSQISINAPVGSTVLVRCLDAAYNSTELTFPVDVVVIAWDGRALGVEPFGHNEAYLVPAGTPIKQTTARRFDALIRTTSAMVGTQYATVKFINTRGQVPGTAQDVVCTAKIPITVTPISVPTGSIVINGGATSTTSNRATLTLSAAAAVGSVLSMQFSKDGGATWFPWENYATTRVVTLLPGNGPKTVSVRFLDSGGKVSDPITAGITLSASLPVGTIAINGGAAQTNTLAATLTLSASSTAGSIVSMQFSKDGGATWFPWENYATTRNVTLLPGNGVKTVSVRYLDNQGNISAPVTASITLGVPLPTGTISINGGALTTALMSASLTLSASSAAGSITLMQFSKDGGATWFPLEPYATTRNVTLLPGDGNKTITVRYQDSVGNLSAPVTAGIKLITANPTGTIAFVTADPTTSATGVLALTAASANGITHMQFSKNGSSYYDWEPFSNTRTVMLAPGFNTLTVRYRDAAGKVSDPVSATITRN